MNTGPPQAADCPGDSLRCERAKPMPTEGAIAHVLVSKFADHLPFYRQSQILARSGIQVDRSTLAD